MSDTAPSRPLVVVLGASGFIGTAVTREFLARPVRLRLVSRRPVPLPPGGVAEVQPLHRDLTEPGAVAAAVAGADVVIHLLAYIKGLSTWRVREGDHAAERVNVGLMHDLIEAVRGQRRGTPPVVVFAGALSQVGTAGGAAVTGEETDEPASEYDRQKLAAERALADATAAGLVRGITLRLPSVCGQGTGPSTLEHGMVGAMMRRAFAGEPLTMWHDGTVARDLVCVDDVARAFAAAVDHADALAGRHWLIGSGQRTTVGELFRAIAEVVARHTGKPPVPVTQVRHRAAAPADLVDFVVGSSAFSRVTGWSPQIPLATALDRAAAARARLSPEQR
ncbi:MAG TPA: NAD-dependent epimerase/dehydratase [Pilimelia sp.]|nr:NAD-dependent epimerase/dehydratase [Pilimelia sp.]